VDKWKSGEVRAGLF